LLPHLWFRNTWGWTSPPGSEPIITDESSGQNSVVLIAVPILAGPKVPVCAQRWRCPLYG
jgi:hypothetical protein